MFTFGAVAAGLVVLIYGITLVSAPDLGDPELNQFAGIVSWVAVLYGLVLLVLQILAVSGLAAGLEWGRVVGTIACLLWCLTLIGIVIAAPILYFLWRPAQRRR